MWQQAKFIEPTTHPELFWVIVAKPEEHTFPPLNDANDGFDYNQRIEGLWYRTNVLEPHGHFCLWAPQEGVELLPVFAPDVEIDRRYYHG